MIGTGSLVATTAGEGPITATVIMAGEGPITDTAAGTGLTIVVGGASLNATCKETPARRCFATGFK